MDAFMKFDGIEGSSQSKDHKGAVDVLSWNWGVTDARRPAPPVAAGGVRPSTRARVPHRPPLRPRVAAPGHQFAATGKHLKDATLNVARLRRRARTSSR